MSKTYDIPREIRTLRVDLNSSEAFSIKAQSNGLSLEQILGGIGISIPRIKEYIELSGQRIEDAFDPRNPLIFSIGGFTGLPVMTGKRTYVTGISPLKANKEGIPGVYYSTSSGGFGPELRKCDLDAIEIIGKAASPKYLFIDNYDGELKISLEDAEHLVGLTTNEKIKQLASEYEGAHMAVIGPGAENMVRYANIAFSTHDQLKNGSKHMRFAGRGGLGALMASKGLEAIIVRGKTKQETYSQIPKEVIKALNKEIAKGDKTLKYREWGTFFANIPALDALRASILYNFSKGQDPKSEGLYKENVEKIVDIVNKGCLGCGINCWKEIKDKDKVVLGKLDYENGALLGPNLGIFDVKQIVEIISLTDDLGLDAMSTGVVLGYIIGYNERCKEGLRFGDVEGIKKEIRDIGLGKNKFLAQGVKQMSKALNETDYAMHCKGIELAAYLGNINPGYAFAFAGMHTSMDTYNRAFYKGGKCNDVDEWKGNITHRGLAPLLYDMNGLCKFSKVGFNDVAKLLNYVHGVNVSEDELKDVTKKVYLLGRAIDEMQGFTEADDVLPLGCHKDMNVNGVEHFNTPEFFKELKKGVYAELDKLKQKYGL